ncbi:MAG: methionyl-tRNA formyltransferase [Chloroflexi bacterium]|nr:methionyl-tRNA formyltransferase [Chloroflexota bacterium]
MRLVFMGTPEFAVPSLERLLADGHQVAAVYTQPDRPAGRGRGLVLSPVKRLALARGLVVVQPESLRPAQEVELLASFSPEAIVVAAFGLILPPPVLELPPLGCINVHPSLLPRHRGPSPVAAAILAGDSVTGVSIMLLDRGMDTGPVLAQENLPIADDDTTGSLTDRLALLGAGLLGQTLPLWQAGQLVPMPQDETQATYSHLLTKEEGEIDWSRAAPELWRMVRAFQPWPGCYTIWHVQRLRLLEVWPLHQGESKAQMGAVLGLASGDVAVQTAEGLLELRRLQLEGRRPLAGAEFVRGQRNFVGSKLPS